MAIVTIDNTSHSLPADEFTAQKVTSYNSLLVALEAAWTAWVPTWTNLTVGNGTVVAKYRQIGKLIVGRVSIVFGSTTSISGSVSLSLPVNRAAYAGTAGITTLGESRGFDSSTGDIFEGIVVNASTSTVAVSFLDASGTYVKRALASSTVPFTWATSDEIAAQFVYEAA